MKDRRMLIIGGLAAVLLIAIPLTVYIANQQQDVRSRASEGSFVATNATPTTLPTSTSVPSPTGVPTATPTTAATPTNTPAASTPTVTGTITPTVASGGACQTPETVSGVDFNYPSCVGTQCNFTQASCSWAAVNGATSYSVKITQVESGTITSTNTVNAPTVTFSFPVEQGKTYRCEISAVNSCGTSGQAGSAQALCAVDGAVTTPTQPAQPTKPAVIPTLKPTGDVSTTAIVGIGGLLVTIAGGLLFLFSGI
jgi:hypothetical protein